MRKLKIETKNLGGTRSQSKDKTKDHLFTRKPLAFCWWRHNHNKYRTDVSTKIVKQNGDKLPYCCRWQNSHLTPKTSLRLGFGGQMPFFPWVTLTFFSLNRFAIAFWLFLSIWDHFRPLWYQSGAWFCTVVDHMEWFWVISQQFGD